MLEQAVRVLVVRPYRAGADRCMTHEDWVQVRCTCHEETETRLMFGGPHCVKWGGLNFIMGFGKNQNQR